MSVVLSGTALAAWTPGDPLVQCGRGGTSDMCTICDIVVGFVDVANYGMYIAGIFGLVAIVAGGVMYTVSGGDSGLSGMGKEAIKKALIGISVVLLSWVIVNSLLMAIGKEGSFVRSQSWGTYSCPAS